MNPHPAPTPGVELLTSCLQIMLIAADVGTDLDGRVSASDRC